MESHDAEISRKKINPFRLRSLLFVPSIKYRFYPKLLELNGVQKPDGIIFDLEDSVHPDFKKEGRELLLTFLNENKRYRKELYKKYVVLIRINSYSTKLFKDDLKIVNEINPDFVMLPKVESPDEIRYIRKKSMLPQLFVCIETLKGVEDRNRILAEVGGSDLFTIGYEDLSSELLIERPTDLSAISPLSLLLLECIISARKKGVLMFDAVSRKFATSRALREFKKECSFTASLGLTGKLAIHPIQIKIINSVFNKNNLLKKAEKVLGKFKRLNDGSFVIVNENREMMDTPSYRAYSTILKLWTNS